MTQNRISMNKLELFIKEKRIKLRELEDDLGIPKRSIQISGNRGIPSRYLEKIKDYLVNEYGYDDNNSLVEVDIPVGKPEKEVTINYRWNKGFIPFYKDDILRYQDPDNGLWRRLWDYQSYSEKDSHGVKTGKRKIRDDFLPDTGEILVDEIGEYYLAKNGIKVYSFNKK